MIGEVLGSEPIEQARAPPVSPKAGEIRRQPFRHRRKPLVLAVGEPQLLPQPLGVLGDHDAERAEPAHRIGGQRRSPPRPWPCSRNDAR